LDLSKLREILLTEVLFSTACTLLVQGSKLH